MASKQIVNRQKSGEAVVAMGESQAERAGAAIGEICKRYLKKGETLPDFPLVMKPCARALEGSTGAMVEADAANEAELSDDEEVRTARDEASQVLYDKIKIRVHSRRERLFDSGTRLQEFDARS